MLIGFHGSMGCGKSTAIKMLEQALLERGDNTKVTLVKFAGPLYEIQEFIYNRIAKVHTRPSTFIKDRKLLQWIGTDWGRNTISENVWVELWKADVNEALARGELVVCDDVRFDNEAEIFKQMGGVLIKISRDNAKSHAEGGVGIVNHASEAGIAPKFLDFVVENNADLESYKGSLARMYQMMSLTKDDREYLSS